MIQGIDETCMLILAHDGGDPSVKTMPRSSTLCSHAMLLPHDKVLVVQNVDKDWRFSGCPAQLFGCTSTSGKPCKFYASAPFCLSHEDGGTIDRVQVGRLCIMDKDPRNDFSDNDIELLSAIANMAADALEHEYQSVKNNKVAQMQQSTSRLLRVVERVAVIPESFDPTSASSVTPTVSERVDPAMPLEVMNAACAELNGCLGAAAVAAFDVRSIAYRVGTRPYKDTQSPSPKYPAGARTAVHQSNANDGPFRTAKLNSDKLPPSLLSFSGREQVRADLTRALRRCSGILEEGLALFAARTDSHHRCKFFIRARQEDEASVETCGRTDGFSELGVDPFARLLSFGQGLQSYAICASHDHRKEKWAIMFLVVFAQTPDFGSQEQLFMEAVLQIASASLLPQQLSGLTLFKSEFLRHVQHQLRTPLHGGLDTVDHLRGAIQQRDGSSGNTVDLSPGGTLSTMLDSIAVSALTLNAYINDLLSFQNLSESRFGTFNHSATNITSVVEATADEEWEQAQRLQSHPQKVDPDAVDSSNDSSFSVELMVRCSPEIRHFEWFIEARMFQTALRKVIGQALRHLRSGYIEINAKVVAPRLLYTAEAGGRDVDAMVEVEVLHTGPDVGSDSSVSSSGHPFGKDDAVHDENGLSMAIVSSILRQYGGSLSVFTGVSSNKAMVVRLPARRGSALSAVPDTMTGSCTVKFAAGKLAFFGVETQGLKRLASWIYEHLSSVGDIQLTDKHSEADCIILPESKASDADRSWMTLVSQSKKDARFVLIQSSRLAKRRHAKSLSGKPTLLLPLPHGPSSLRLLETFLSDDQPMLIYTAETSQERRERTTSMQSQSFSSASAETADELDA